MSGLEELAVALHDGVLRSVRVACVVRVEAYDPATQTADVRQVVAEEREVDGERVAVPSPLISGCPVIWPGTILRGITMGLEVGSECIALARTQSHDEVDADAADGLPAAARRLDLSDLVILAGYVRPGAGAPADSYHAGGEITVYMPGAERLRVGDATAALALARADMVDARLQSLVDIHNAHIHTSAVAGSPTTPPVVAASYPGSTACHDILVRS